MSELIKKHDNRATIRWKLLTGASALALTAYVSSAGMAKAEDAGRPQIWIELGGQLSSCRTVRKHSRRAFMSARPSIFSPSQKFEKPPLFGFDEDGKISFQPDNSDWVFSASIRYGRSASNQACSPADLSRPVRFNIIRLWRDVTPYQHGYPLPPDLPTRVHATASSHPILDFQAGKDVGLGMFGSKDGSSVSALGVRFAQFSSQIEYRAEIRSRLAFSLYILSVLCEHSLD